jgi:hypothetical protein
LEVWPGQFTRTCLLEQWSRKSLSVLGVLCASVVNLDAISHHQSFASKGMGHVSFGFAA